MWPATPSFPSTLSSSLMPRVGSSAALSPPVRFWLAQAPAVGVSGARRPAPASLAALHAVLPLARGVVFTGCAVGIDQAARALVPPSHLSVFSAASFGVGAWTFAVRSQACVEAVAAAGGVWLSFPASACPSGLWPSRSASACFSGSGSGTWASLAFALGLGCPALVFLPRGVAPPSGWGLRLLGQWGSAVSGGSWWWAPGSQQAGLF